MSIRKIDEIVKLGKHPLEEHFDIERGSTEIVVTKRNTELTEYQPYDEKDKELEQDYQLVMDSALDLVDRLREHIDGGAEAKFLARLAEVAGQNLSLALTAAEKKAKLKDNKDKFNFRKSAAPGNKNITNNTTIIATQSEVLAALGLSRSEDVIDVQATEIKENNNE